MAFCQGIFRKLPPRANTSFVPKTSFFAYFKQTKKRQVIMFTQRKCTQKPNEIFNYCENSTIFKFRRFFLKAGVN